MSWLESILDGGCTHAACTAPACADLRKAHRLLKFAANHMAVLAQIQCMVTDDGGVRFAEIKEWLAELEGE